MSKKLMERFYNEPENVQELIKREIETFLQSDTFSQKDLAEKITSISELKVERKAANELRKQLGYPEKDIELSRLSKQNKSKMGKDPLKEESLNQAKEKIQNYQSINSFIDRYLNGEGIDGLCKEVGLTQFMLIRVFESEDVEIRKAPKTYHELIIELENKGWNKNRIKELYFQPDLKWQEFMDILGESINHKFTENPMRRILKKLDIVKPMDLIKTQQGAKSRKELIQSINRLKKAGFESREDLAQYYHDNKNLTKQSLVEMLNSKLDDEDTKFTLRWLGRHLDPFLPADRLKGTSRVEKEFQDEIMSILSEEDRKTVSFNDRSVITPYELDIVIPAYNVAIEFNGNYWHSDRFLLENHNMTSVEYHTMKQKLCRDKGLDVLFVWEYDWMDDRLLIIRDIAHYLATGEKNEFVSKLES